MLNYMAEDRAFVAAKNAQIFELEAQIAALQNSISLLRAAQQPALERLNSYKYPVLTLPMDVVSEIFVHFLPPYPIRPPLGGTSSPTVLTHICRRWRGIALAFPALWRAINLTVDRQDMWTNHPRAALLAPMWLERSGSLPLSIEFVDFEEDADGSLPLFSSLLPYCTRWEHIALSLPDANPLGTIGHSMPLLRSIDLWVSEAVGHPIVIQDVPFLHTVALNDFGSPSISLPWLQLTSIAMRSVYSNHILAILRQTPRLIDCTLKLWSEPYEDPLENVVLLRLETLVFEADSAIDVEFFESLVTPALHCLEVPEEFLSSEEQSTYTESLQAYISKSGCKLHELRITKATVGAQAYHDAFPSIPSIKHLSAEGSTPQSNTSTETW